MQVSSQEERASKLDFIRQVFLFIPLSIILPLLVSKSSIMDIEPSVSVFFAMPISKIISLFFYSGSRSR